MRRQNAPRSRPQFIAYRGADLPGLIPAIARRLFGLPILTWTIRSEAERQRVLRYADQVIFEALSPLPQAGEGKAREHGIARARSYM